MAKKIVITGDSSQFKQEFDRTAQDIDRNLERLGRRTADVNATQRDRAAHYRAAASGVGSDAAAARSNIKEHEKTRSKNNKYYDDIDADLEAKADAARKLNRQRANERARLNRTDPNLSDDEKRQRGDQNKAVYEETERKIAERLAQRKADNKQQRNNDNDTIDSDIAAEREKENAAKEVQTGLRELALRLREAELAQKTRHAEWKQLSKKEIDAKLKQTAEALGKETDAEKRDELTKDKAELERLKREKANEERKGDDPMETMRKLAMWHYIGKTTQDIGNAVGDTTGSAVGAINNTISGTAASGMLAPAVLLPMALMNLLPLLLNKGKELETARDNLGGLTSKARGSMWGSNDGAEALGIDQAEFMNAAHGVAQQRGSAKGLEAATMNQLRMKKAFGLDDNQLGQVNQFAKVGLDNPVHGINRLLGMLQRSALVNLDPSHFDVSALGHYLEKIVQLDSRSLEITGRANHEQNVNLMGSIMSLGGIFKDYRTASTTTSGIQGQFNNQSDDARRYMNAQAILSAHPELRNDPLGIYKMMENPDAASVASLHNQTLERARANGGDNKYGDFIVASQMKEIGYGSYAKGEAAMRAGRMGAANIGDANVDINGRAQENSGMLSKWDAKLANELNRPGEGAIKVLDTTLRAMTGGASLMDILKAIKEMPIPFAGGGDAKTKTANSTPAPLPAPAPGGRSISQGYNSRSPY